jgi:phosphoglycolate phosphatase
VEYGAHDKQSLLELNPLYSAQSVAQLHAWLMEHA